MIPALKCKVIHTRNRLNKLITNTAFWFLWKVKLSFWCFCFLTKSCSQVHSHWSWKINWNITCSVSFRILSLNFKNTYNIFLWSRSWFCIKLMIFLLILHCCSDHIRLIWLLKIEDFINIFFVLFWNLRIRIKLNNFEDDLIDFIKSKYCSSLFLQLIFELNVFDFEIFIDKISPLIILYDIFNEFLKVVVLISSHNDTIFCKFDLCVNLLPLKKVTILLIDWLVSKKDTILPIFINKINWFLCIKTYLLMT